MLGPESDPPVWQRLARPGRHEFYGGTGDPNLLASVDHPEYLPRAEIPVVRGTRDLRVVLDKGGSLDAVILAVPQFEPRVELTLHGVRYEPQPRESQPRVPTPFMSLAWQGLPTGSYTLAVSLPHEDEPAFTLRDLQVVAGQRCSDPRLARIDLFASVRRVTLTVTSGSGEPIRADTIRITATRLGVSQDVARWADPRGGCVLLLPRPTDVVIAAAGYRTRVLHGLDRDTAVALEPGLFATVRCSAFAVPSEAFVYVYAVRDGNWIWTQTSRHQPGESATLRFLEAGTYTVTYWLVVGQKGERLETRKVEILDRTGPQAVEFGFSAEHVAQALDRLGK